MSTPPFRTGNGATWLDFLATLAGRYRPRQQDAISSPQELTAWLASVDRRPVATITDDDADDARRLREALHAVTVAVMRREAPDGGDLGVLTTALAAERPVRISSHPKGIRLEPPASAAGALAGLARDATLMLTGPDRDRLHACGDDSCSGIFLDATGRRRWCSDERCGNRHRVRAHRARTKAAGGSVQEEAISFGGAGSPRRPVERGR